MPELRTRADLLYAIRSLRDDIERLAAEVGEDRAVEPNVFGELSFKDVVAHLNGWRQLTALRLEAGLTGESPVPPWPEQLDEDVDLDAINHWFFEAGRDKTLATVLAESRETLDRSERAIAALPDDALFERGHFDWLGDEALGPAVVEGTVEHFRIDHEPEIRAWLAGGRRE